MQLNWVVILCVVGIVIGIAFLVMRRRGGRD